MQVAHTPAIATDAGGLSGGVAVLVPLGFSMLKNVVILESPMEKGESLQVLQSWICSDACMEY